MISQELSLDASSAEQTISIIDQELQQVATLFQVALADALSLLQQPITVGVAADTTEAEAAIVGLASAPPVDVPVAADTTEAEQLILALGDVPPVNVPVDADTTPAVESITALETTVPPIDIPVEADTADASAQIADLGAESASSSGNVDMLQGSVTGLGAAAGLAEGSARELVSAVGELGGEGGKAAAGGVLALTAATTGFFEEGLNAVSAGQRFDMTLGDMANKIKEVDVNGLHTSMEDLGISFGSTGAEMENVNSKLYQNAINAGVSKDKAVEFTQQIETLAARAIALNPTLGTLDEVASNLGDKLARGGRFAGNYQIQLTAAEIATRALADTGKTSASDLTILEKSMAGAELASEKYGDTLAGTVAEGQKNAAIQAEELKAKFKEAIEQIGTPLVSPVLELITEAEPDAVLIAQTLGHLAEDVLPLVREGVEILGPPLQLLAFVLDSIPAPLIQGAAAWYLFGTAISVVAGESEAAMILMPELAIAVGVVAAAVGVYNAVFGDAAPYTDDVTKAVDAAAKGFEDFSKSVADVTTEEVDAALQTTSFREALDRTNISRDQLAASLAQGGDAFATYAGQILYAAEAEGVGFDGAVKLREELTHLKDATEAESLKALQMAVDQHLITKEQMDGAIAASGNTDATRSTTVALNNLTPAITSAKDAIAAKKKADEEAKTAAEEHAKAMDLISTSAPQVALHLADVQQTTGDVAAALGGLGESLGSANLETKQFDAVAQELGVTSEQLKGFVHDVTAEIDGFVSTAMKGLPTVSSAIDDVLNPKKKPDKPIIIDPAKLQAEIDDDIAKIDAFNLQLAYLTQHGLDNLAKEAAQRGPEFTGALVKSIQDGGDDVGAALDGKFGELNAKTRAEGPLLTDAGTSIVTATGDIGRDMSKNFGDTFNIAKPTDDQLQAAKTIAIQEQIPFKEALRQVAGDAAVAYQERLSGLPVATASALTESGTAIDGGAKGLADSATGAGQGVSGGFTGGMSGLPGTAGDIVRGVGPQMSVAAAILRTVGYSEGFAIGQSFDAGLASGINVFVASITTAARNAVQAGVDAARQAAGVKSPSTVMIELGSQMAEGLAIGLGNSSSVIDQGRRLVASAVPSIVSPSLSPGFGMVAGARSGGAYATAAGGGAGPSISIGAVHIVLDAAASRNPSLAAQSGAAAADAFKQRLGPVAARSVVVSGSL